MRTKLTNTNSLYQPDFTYTVGKYSDNGHAKTSAELKDYFAFYQKTMNRNDRIDTFLTKYKKIARDLMVEKIRNKIQNILRR